MPDFSMPSLGADMEYGTVLKWLVEPGDVIHRGDIVVEVETEKATMEVECFQDGIVGEILVPAGEKVPVGTPLATILAEAGVKPAPAPKPEAKPTPAPEAVARPEAPLGPPPSAPAAPVLKRITPTARALAERLGISLETVEGTGVAGAITRADVERLARAPSLGRGRVSPRARRLAGKAGLDVAALSGTGAGGAVTGEDVLRASEAVRPRPPVTPVEAPAVSALSGRQRVIGALMERAKREIPHYYLSTTIDLSHVMAWLEAQNLNRPVEQRLIYSAVLLKAVATAVAKVPEMNGHYERGEFSPSTDVHIGLAVSLRDGSLVAPAIQDVGSRTIDEIMSSVRDVVSRARAERLRSSEMTTATITVTNLGDRGVEVVHGIIYPPQVAIVGFGKVIERPWAEGGMLGIRPTIVASLAADHRVSNGHRGGIFLSALEQLLQEPEKL